MPLIDLTTGIRYLRNLIGTLTPGTSNTYDLGSTSLLFRNIFAQGYVIANQLVTANTITASPTTANGNTIYTNTGDSDGSIISLPNDPTAGTTFWVAVDAAQTITINPAAGESIYLAGVAYSTSISSSTVGSMVKLTAITGGSGGKWVALATGTWAGV